MNKNTAILIFAHSAKEELKHKPFRSAQVLFDELNRQTIVKVEKTGLPYFLFSEEEQIGESFGERYTNAIQAVYEKGFQNIITIGNDTPHLTSSQLLQTANLLEKEKIVLGPSTDGGFYLLGLHKSQFNPKTFLKLPWQTSRLFQSINKLVAFHNCKTVLLEKLQDIDSVSDAHRLLNSFRKISNSLLTILLAIISDGIQFFSRYSFNISSFQKRNPFNKGSPVVLFQSS